MSELERDEPVRDDVERYEPERYELEERPAYSFGLDRRDFFRVLGGGVHRDIQSVVRFPHAGA